MKTPNWKQMMLNALCILGVASILGCNSKSDSEVHSVPPSGAHISAADSEKTSGSHSKPKEPASKDDSGPLGVRPPDSTPPADSRGGSGTGTPTGPGSSLPSGTSGGNPDH